MIEWLFVSIMKKYLNEMETMAEKIFEMIWDNDPKNTCNFAKEFYKEHSKDKLACI